MGVEDNTEILDGMCHTIPTIHIPINNQGPDHTIYFTPTTIPPTKYCNMATQSNLISEFDLEASVQFKAPELFKFQRDLYYVPKPVPRLYEHPMS